MDIKIRRAVLSVSDKTGLKELAEALVKTGCELFASGGTRKFLEENGIASQSVEKITKCPEAFQGRMKTLSFQMFSGILSRRGDPSDAVDLKKLEIQEIDAVIVNFYPFESAQANISQKELIELIDIGGPAMVRAAAKNADAVLVAVDPSVYSNIIFDLNNSGKVSLKTRQACALEAWNRVSHYDQAIHKKLMGTQKKTLRYGENPHQKAHIEIDLDSPIDWSNPLTQAEFSYNNITDMTAAYLLGRELQRANPNHASVVIIKHGNPCGVASVPETDPDALVQALELAWEGDNVSAFGGVLLFNRPLTEACAKFLSGKFIDSILLVDTGEVALNYLKTKKNMKAVKVNSWNLTKTFSKAVSIPGGVLMQSLDEGLDAEFKVVSGDPWSSEKIKLTQFGTVITRALKSNAIGVVYNPRKNVFQLVGAGQGQPNRVDALEKLAIHRALQVLKSPEKLAEAILISDAFFPFSDSIESAHRLGIRSICEPGGSIKDAEVIETAKRLKIDMVFSGVRHFNH